MSKILNTVKMRMEYLKIVGGCSEANVESIKDMVLETGYIADELAQFEESDEDEFGELRRLMIEASASILLMVSIADKDGLWKKKKSDSETLYDAIMSHKDYPFCPMPTMVSPITTPEDGGAKFGFEPFWTTK